MAMEPTNHIIVTTPYTAPAATQVISWAQAQKMSLARRRRVAKRLFKKQPLFAVALMQQEFPGYTHQMLEEDIKPRSKSKKREKKKKTPMVRQGRYAAYRKALERYRNTGEESYLLEAKRLRERMYQRFEVEFRLKGRTDTMLYTYPSTTPMRFILALTQLKFTSWEDLAEKIAAVEKEHYLGMGN